MHPNEKMTPYQSLAVNGRSFYWASLFLAPGARNRAAQLYAFCRVLDDLADGDISDGEVRLSRLQRALNSGHKGSDVPPSEWQPFLQETAFSKPVLSALVDGLVRDAGGSACLDCERDLLRYAYRVAGTVGLLMCDVLDCHAPEAKDYAVDLGIAMQLTNIARDVLEDARMGRRYIPGEWVSDLSPEAICAAAASAHSLNHQRVTAAVARLLALADKYYQSGAQGYRYLPARARVSIAVAARVYREIGVQLAGAGHSWHLGRQVTSRATKTRCSFQAAFSLLFERRDVQVEEHDAALHAALTGLPEIRKNMLV